MSISAFLQRKRQDITVKFLSLARLVLSYDKMCGLWLHYPGMQGKQVAARLSKLHKKRMLLLARHQRILRQAALDD
jgi:hypothetical protein